MEENHEGTAMTNHTVLATTMTSQAGELHRFIVDCMQAVGASPQDARYMAGQLLASELAGHASHGMRRLSEYVDRALEGHAKPAARATVEKDSGALVRMNGHETYGHFALRDATALAIQRAKIHGIAAVAVHNSEYAGRLAPFCEEAAEAGVVTLVFGNNNGAGQVVVPPGGTQARLSTNPIAAGVPRAKAPHLVIDFATSAVASGRLAEERDRGTVLSKEWVSQDGMLKPFGGFKGFGLALIVEALGGALSTSETVSERTTADQQGTLIIAIDVSQLRDLEDFTAQVEEFIAHVKSSELEDEAKPIRVPGEKAPTGDALSADRGITMIEKTWTNMKRIAMELCVEMPAQQ